MSSRNYSAICAVFNFNVRRCLNFVKHLHHGKSRVSCTKYMSHYALWPTRALSHEKPIEALKLQGMAAQM